MDRMTQFRMKESKALNVNVVPASCNDVIYRNVSLASVLRRVQSQRDAATILARLQNGRAEMNRKPVYNSIAEPPRAFGRQVAFHEAHSPI